MESLYELLAAKVDADPSRTRRGGPRADLGLLLFNHRAALFELWSAASEVLATARAQGTPVPERLVAAVEELSAVFGER